MKLQDLKKEISKYQYFEDTNIIDAALASIVATRLEIGDPIWLIIIGASSGGKSQILRPLSLTDRNFIHRIDDLTENTFLSGSLQKSGEVSLLNRIGEKGILVMSDLTVLFSKNAEARATILSQFRMIYDGEMVKYSGNSTKPIEWKGSLGVLAGSTPSIYAHFEEVADMGERFVYWRMKDYSAEKAANLVINRTIFGKGLDEKLSELYADYLKDTIQQMKDKKIELSNECKQRIIKIACLAELVRSPIHTEWDGTMDKLPIPAYPMRVVLQLSAIAKGLLAMRKCEFGDEAELSEVDYSIIDWLGYSLANEEKRSVLRVLANFEYDIWSSTQVVADKVGLDTSIIKKILQNLAAVGVLERNATDSLLWKFNNNEYYRTIRHIEGIVDVKTYSGRELAKDEADNNMLNDIMNKF